MLQCSRNTRHLSVSSNEHACSVWPPASLNPQVCVNRNTRHLSVSSNGRACSVWPPASFHPQVCVNRNTQHLSVSSNERACSVWPPASFHPQVCVSCQVSQSCSLCLSGTMFTMVRRTVILAAGVGVYTSDRCGCLY